MDRQNLVHRLGLVNDLATDGKDELKEQFSAVRFNNNNLYGGNGLISVKVEIEEDCDLNTSVPSRILHSLLSSLSADEIDLTVKSDQLWVKCPGSKGRLVAVSYAKYGDFLIGLFDQKLDWKPLPKGFVDGLNLCRFSCSHDISDGALRAVNVNGNKLSSSDRYRLTRYVMPESFDPAINLPATFIDQIKNEDLSDARYAVHEDVFFLNILPLKAIFASELITINFPETDKFFDIKDPGIDIAIPDNIKIILNRHLVFQKDLMDFDKVVKIIVSKDKMVVECTGTKGEFQQEIEIEYSGKEFSFRINPIFFKEAAVLVDTMTVIPSENLVMFHNEFFTHLLKLSSGPRYASAEVLS